MRTYISGTTTEIQNPDLTKGYTYPGRIWRGMQDVVMLGSVETFPPEGLRERKNVYEDCLFYVEGTPPETTPPEQSTGLDTRVSALETGQADLQEALNMILTGVTE